MENAFLTYRSILKRILPDSVRIVRLGVFL